MDLEKEKLIAKSILEGDERRKSIILNNIKNILTKKGITFDSDKIEKLFLEACQSYLDENFSVCFSIHYMSYINKRIEKLQGTNENTLFNRLEKRIIDQYLDIEKLFSSYEIGKNLGINVTDVTTTINKLKELYSNNSKQILDLYPNFIDVVSKRQNLKPNKGIITIKRKDLELIGQFTGQFDDICLDIEEIAEKNFTSKDDIEFQLKKFILSLKDKRLYEFLLKEYPNIQKMLILKANVLGLKPKDFLPKDEFNRITSNKESDNNLKTDENIIDETYSKKYYNKVKNCAEFFKDVYLKKDDGSYASLEELAKKYTISKQAIYSRKKNLLKKLENNILFKRDVLKEYPSLYEDKLEYDKKQENNRYNSEIFLKDIVAVVEFCKNIYQTKINDKFLNYASIAKIKGIPYSDFIYKKRSIFSHLEKDEDFKKLVLENYPNLFQDKETYEKDENKVNITFEINNEKIQEYANILKLYYKDKNDGTYNSLKDVASLMGETLSNINSRKIHIMKLINDDKNIKEQILNIYPNLFLDIAIRKAISSHRKGIKNTIDTHLANNIAMNYANFMMNIYHEEGEHKSLSSHLESINYTMKEFLMKIKKISKLLDNEKEVRRNFNKYYPLFHEEMEKFMREEKKEKDLILAAEKAPQYVVFLKKLFYKNSNGNYSPNFSIASSLKELNFKDKKIARISIYNEIESNKFLKEAILKLFPEFLDEKNKYDKYLEMSNQFISNCENKKVSTNNTSKSKISDIEFLKLILKKKEDNKYLTNVEIASLLKHSESNISFRRIKILDRIETDTDFNNYIMKNNPELLEELKNYKNDSKYEKRKNSIEVKYSEFLKLIYQKKEDGTYRDVSEITKILGINNNSFYTKRYKILNHIDTDTELKNRIIKIYPNFLEDINSYEEFQHYSLNENETEIANLLLTNKTKKIISFSEIATNLNISPSYVKTLEDNALEKISNNFILKKTYPTALEEAIIRSNASRKIITISSNELQNIRVNSEKLDNEEIMKKRAKSSLLKGIKALEKSIYKDYVTLCDYKHKAILALRLGFFNNTIFGSEDIAKLFNISVEKIDFLTNECLKLYVKNDKYKEMQKVY